MRRKEREITDKVELEEILRRAPVCRLAMAVEDQPYVVPLCFAYRDGDFFFHCAREGMKLDMIRKNTRVCVECDVDHEIVASESPCEWGMKGRSVVGFGKVSLIETPEEKREALGLIMEHYGAKGPFVYKEKGFEKSLILRVRVETMTGKRIV